MHGQKNIKPLSVVRIYSHKNAIPLKKIVHYPKTYKKSLK